MAIISMKQLLEAGVHFGHQTRRWNPKMKKYIYTDRNGIYIIDLQKTAKKLDEAYYALQEVAKDGGRIRGGQFWVNQRWLGGTLTNFKTIQARIARLEELETMEQDGTFEVLPKKEVITLRKEMDRLNKFLGGIRDMKELPSAIFVIDPRKERIAIAEARKLNIPVFGIVDTNCDPEDVDYVIPANDDAIRAVRLIVGKMVDAIIEVNQGSAEEVATEEVVAEEVVAAE